MNDAIAIRKKVAELCGYADLHFFGDYSEAKWNSSKEQWDKFPTGTWHGIKNGLGGLSVPLPTYEIFLDAITQAFDDHGLTYVLRKTISQELGCIGYFASSNDIEKFSYSAAKAMCYLFIQIMEDRDNQHSPIAHNEVK